MPIEIGDLQFDEGNESEMARHGVAPEEVLQVAMGDFKAFRNKKGRAASHVLIGPTLGGRLLSIPIVTTEVEGVWRPVTAWEASDGERTKYEK